MRQKITVILFSCFIVIAFFYQILLGKIPFPGDLLVNLEPYRSYSYDGFQAGSIPNKAQGPDVIHELLPWKKFAINSWKNLQVPLWDPYNFSGNPLMANFQSGVFYPGNIIFLLIDFNNAWTIYIVLTPLLSILFTYLFLRRLNLSTPASLYGGLAFAFSLYMTVWMEYGNIGHTFLWLPLILYFLDRLIFKIDLEDFVGIIAAIFFASLAGYIQGLFYIYSICFVYYIFKAYSLKTITVKKSLLTFVAFGFPILLSSFQLLPTLEIFKASTRGNYSLEQIQQMLNPAYYLVTVIIPDFFGNPASRNYWFDGTYIERVSYFGLIPLVLALVAIFALIKRAEVKAFTLLFIFTLFISTDLFVTRFFYLIPIPVISTTIATRILCIFAFSGAVLSAFGFDYLLEGKDKRKVLIITGIMSLATLVIFGFTFIYPKTISDAETIVDLAVSKRNILIPLALMIIFTVSVLSFYYLNLAKKFKKSIFIVIVLGLTAFELFYYFQKITPFAPGTYMYPQTPVMSFIQKNAGINRFWGYGSAYIDSNFQTYDSTFSPEGNDPLHIKEYTQILVASKNGHLPDKLPRPDANIAGGYGTAELADNPYRQKVLNVTGVKYVLNRSEALGKDYSPDIATFPPNKYKLVWQKGPWQAYENLLATPRFFLTNKYVVISNENNFFPTLFKKDFNEKTTLILDEDPKVKNGELAQSVKLLSYTPNKVILKATASAPALLYLSDNYYPGWEAMIDGKNTKIYKANYTFRAVKVENGTHTVVFEYKPRTFIYGLYIFVASLIGLVLCIVFIRNNKNVFKK